MSVYPPPLSQTPIFNPSSFTETVTSVIGGSSPPDPTTYLEFPEAQGAETFTNNGGNNTLVVGASELSIGYDLLTVPKGIAFNGQGFAYNDGAVVSSTTWSGLQTKIEAIQALAPASDATTLNVNDAICIQNGETPVGTNNIIISTSAGDNQLLLNDSAGTLGYVLTSGGADGSMTWEPASGGGDLQATLNLGNSATNVDGNVGSIQLTSATGTNVINSTTMVITNEGITTTFSATGMGTGSTTQPLNINAPFTLVSPVIDAPDLPLCYTPYAGYGDALIVYNNVGIVPEVSNGFAEVIFQNISATSQSSNIIAICESDGDYMTMGQVSQTGTALYNTLFEIQGAGYVSSTGNQIIGANSSSSADKSVVISYGNGTAGLQISPSGAIGLNATPLITSGVVSLQDGDFGEAGQVLTSQGSTTHPTWETPSGGTTPSLAEVLAVSPEGIADEDQTITLTDGTETLVLGNNMTISTPSTYAESIVSSNGFSSQTLDVSSNNVALVSITASTETAEMSLTYLDPETTGTSISLNSTNDSISILHKETGIHDTTTIQSSQIIVESIINSTTSTLTSSSLEFLGQATYTGDAITSTTASFSIQNPTLINIGTSGDVPPKTIAIGHQGASLADYATLNLNGKLNFNNLLFSGGIGFTIQQSVATYTIPADADRNTFFNLYISGTANPTPVIFPTDDVGGKYITIYNGGANDILLSCPASPVRPFIGGVIGVSGASTYPLRINQTVSFVSGGSQGFINLYATNPNSNQVNNPYPVQTATRNQRIFSIRITSVTGTYTYPTAFGSAPTVQLTAEDATGNHIMTLRTSTTTGFTYVSSSGSFPTALHIYAVGT